MSVVASGADMAKALRDIASEIATAEGFESGALDVTFDHVSVTGGDGVVKSVPTGRVTIEWSATFWPGRKTKIT